MTSKSTQAGFSAVELLITLFVAAAFLVAGYQLYSLIIKDSGQTRSQARASNVTYDYMRRYSVTPYTANPCATANPLTASPLTVTGLSAVTISVVITCPYPARTNVSRIEVTTLYNSPQQTIKQATYVKF